VRYNPLHTKQVRTEVGKIDFVDGRLTFLNPRLCPASMYGARCFQQGLTLEDGIASHACSHDCSLHVSKRAANGNPLGCSLLLPVGTVNSVQTRYEQVYNAQNVHTAGSYTQSKNRHQWDKNSAEERCAFPTEIYTRGCHWFPPPARLMKRAGV
jgi:hypothetical protein